MSPRSADFLRQALARLDDARYALADDRRETAVSTAYYACLYAARAALSEEQRSARTHRGVWSSFHETFVRSGRIDPGLHAAAASQQREREDVDYDAAELDRATADEALRTAERFVGAVRELLDEA